ncbi:hypothetical protein EON65_27855 [archaeon]|nr:MAG: hypothetical protein EON65_27855 [archaeon]
MLKAFDLNSPSVCTSWRSTSSLKVEEVTDHQMCFFIAPPPSVIERPQPPRPYYMPRQAPAPSPRQAPALIPQPPQQFMFGGSAPIPQPPQQFMNPSSSQWSTVKEIGDDVGALTSLTGTPKATGTVTVCRKWRSCKNVLVPDGQLVVCHKEQDIKFDYCTYH